MYSIFFVFFVCSINFVVASEEISFHKSKGVTERLNSGNEVEGKRFSYNNEYSFVREKKSLPITGAYWTILFGKGNSEKVSFYVSNSCSTDNQFVIKISGISVHKTITTSCDKIKINKFKDRLLLVEGESILKASLTELKGTRRIAQLYLKDPEGIFYGSEFIFRKGETN